MERGTRILWFIALLLAAGHLSAADDGMQHLRISTEMRTDYRNDLGHPGVGVAAGDNGFRVNNLFLRIDGRIDDHFSYAFRQRLNRMNPDPSVMASVDWAQLIWSPDERWSLAAGKQVMEVGSMEYDANPNDVFRYSEWIQQAAAYQLGASVTRHLGANDDVVFQIAQSLCDNEALHRYLSYNISWRHSGPGIWRPYWSANLHQYAPRGYMAMTALGNRFYFGHWWICLDWVQRSTLRHIRQTGRPAEDFTLIGCVDWRMTRHVTLTFEGSYDHNADDADDGLAFVGTRLGVIGGGILWYPMADSRYRLHATFSHTFGENPNGTLHPDAWGLNIGLTWRLNLINN